MGAFRVTPEQLLALAGELQQGAADVDAVSDALRSRVAPVREDWSGDASGRFEALWDQWGASARMLQEALEGISTLLRTSGTNYGETEAAVTKGFAVDA
jgi:WXG100 family type VII secretion target